MLKRKIKYHSADTEIFCLSKFGESIENLEIVLARVSTLSKMLI